MLPVLHKCCVLPCCRVRRALQNHVLLCCCVVPAREPAAQGISGIMGHKKSQNPDRKSGQNRNYVLRLLRFDSSRMSTSGGCASPSEQLLPCRCAAPRAPGAGRSCARQSVSSVQHGSGRPRRRYWDYSRSGSALCPTAVGDARPCTQHFAGPVLRMATTTRAHPWVVQLSLLKFPTKGTGPQRFPPIEAFPAASSRSRGSFPCMLARCILAVA